MKTYFFAGEGTVLNVQGTTITACKSTGRGGALYVSGGGTANLQRAKVSFSVAETDGGGAYIDGSTVMASDQV